MYSVKKNFNRFNFLKLNHKIFLYILNIKKYIINEGIFLFVKLNFWTIKKNNGKKGLNRSLQIIYKFKAIVNNHLDPLGYSSSPKSFII